MTNKHANSIASIRCVLMMACLATIPAGCGDSSPSLLGDSRVPGVASARAEAKRVIDEALADTDPVVRVNAIEVVGTAGRVDLMPKVQRLLKDPTGPVRFAAALAVGDLQYAPAKGLLAPLLKDEDSNVIIAASYAMGRLGAADYYRVVIQGAENKDQTVRANAVMLLGKIGDRQFLKSLKAAQEDQFSSDAVRFQALEARARLGDEEVLKRLWALAYSAYADDRVLATRALGSLAMPQIFSSRSWMTSSWRSGWPLLNSLASSQTRRGSRRCWRSLRRTSPAARTGRRLKGPTSLRHWRSARSALRL